MSGGVKYKPFFTSTSAQFQTILFAVKDTSNVGDCFRDVSEKQLADRQQIILSLIKKSPTISARHMSEILSVSQRTVERDISRLKEKGILKHKGKDNGGMWIIEHEAIYRGVN